MVVGVVLQRPRLLTLPSCCDMMVVEETAGSLFWVYPDLTVAGLIDSADWAIEPPVVQQQFPHPPQYPPEPEAQKTSRMIGMV